ncbi:hypothetical protein RSOL_322120 [Rhizoctonia solani AG-3 Rhs1AP]|uniref:Uncharacterized protein n=2 Tax=Rhizoctonia solani AG-3 TaxID=1086053 RepID=A0A074SZP3_9AGAM|nr:hypothetical protein RSOL_322120 [Rhizoctonia solani AG-3 Rhs1AP]KEP55237.1 hypothetical protein V565_007440 [Rhizoctonia solani 123E]
MIGLESFRLSPGGIESGQPAQAQQAGHLPPRVPARVLTADVPVHTSCNKLILASVPLAWPSIIEHDPEVNLSITRFLLTLQHLYDIYTAWGEHRATTRDISDTFNELVEQWHTVEDSYQDCCRTSVKEVEEGLSKIRRLCGATFNHKGPNWIHMKNNQSQFSSSVRVDVIGKLKELRHFHNSRV